LTLDHFCKDFLLILSVVFFVAYNNEYLTYIPLFIIQAFSDLLRFNELYINCWYKVFISICYIWL